MKNLNKKMLFALALSVSVASAYAYNPYDTIINQADSGGTPADQIIAEPSDNSVVMYRPGPKIFQYFKFGSGLDLNTAGRIIEVVDVPQSSVVGLVSALSSINSSITSKADSSTVSSLSSTVSSMVSEINSNLYGTSTTMLAGYGGIVNGLVSTTEKSTWNGVASALATATSSLASLTTTVAGKFNTPTGTTAQYLRGDGTLATFPSIPSGTVTSITAGTGLSGGTITSSGTISLPNVGTSGTYGAVTTDAQGRVTAGKRVEVYSGTTTASGTYTVTFGTAYSVAPNIQANILSGSDTQFTRITSISTTGFTVTARNRTDILGLLPTYSNVTGASVDVLITEK